MSAGLSCGPTPSVARGTAHPDLPLWVLVWHTELPPLEEDTSCLLVMSRRTTPTGSGRTLDDLPGEHDTKAEAVRVGRDEARERKVEHIIRNLDGTIGERNTYGHAPRNIPG